MLHQLWRKWTPRSRRPRSSQKTAGQWNLVRLEDRTVPATIGFAVGSGPNGNVNQVKVFDTSGNEIAAFSPFANFNGGANVALGDLTGDGIPDLVVGAGQGGGPHVVVIDGAAIEAGGSALANAVAHPLKSFYAYDVIFRGGVNVAVGDVDGQADPLDPTKKRMDIVTGAGAGGGPHVKAFVFSDLSVITSFYAYDKNFGGGVSVACGNVGGDTGFPSQPFSSDEIVTGAGPGGGPHVKVFSPKLNAAQTDVLTPYQPDQIGQFYAFAANNGGGVNVGCGLITNNMDAQGHTYADIITSNRQGGGNVIDWRLDNGQNTGTDSLFSFVQAANFFPFGTKFSQGVFVNATVFDFNSDGLPDIITGGGKGSTVSIFGSKSLTDLETYDPPLLLTKVTYPNNYNGGVVVA
jgi:hypothetical protein